MSRMDRHPLFWPWVIVVGGMALIALLVIVYEARRG